jgi:arginine repressor
MSKKMIEKIMNEKKMRDEKELKKELEKTDFVSAASDW